MAVVARTLWLVIASLAACVGVHLSLWAFHDGAEHVLSVFALLRYAVVVAALGAAGYGVHRLAFRRPAPDARSRAVHDAALAGVLAGPTLYAGLVLVSAVAECSFGTGC